MSTKWILSVLCAVLTFFLIIFVLKWNMASTRLISVDYEVFGKVQGVFFRKFTTEQAKTLGLKGWVKNSSGGTVVGTVQGPESQIKMMKNWLARTGSPKSRIDDCQFQNEQDIPSYGYLEFKVIREAGEKQRRVKKSRPKVKT